MSALNQQVQAFGGGTPVTSMVLTAPGTVRVDILSHGTNICSGDFGLSTPTLQPIFTNYDQISDFTVADVGTFASGQELTFYLDVSATSCGTPREFSTDYRWAHIFSVGPNLWEIDWEDVQQPDGVNAYGDFVVLVGLFASCTSICAQQFAGSGNPNGNDPTGSQAEPVNTYSGNYTTSATDLAMPGRGLAFTFTRTYNSVLSSVDGVFGPGWSGAFGSHLSFGAGGLVNFSSDDGAVLRFESDGGGGYRAALGILSTLVANVGGTYTLKRVDGVSYTFDASGRLTALGDRNQNQIAFAYTGSNLSSITDTVGRVVSVTTNAGHITGLADPAGRTVTYTYGTGGRLATVTDVRGGITQYGYDTGGRLATITDQNNHVLVTNTYDGQGRVVGQLDALGHPSTFVYDGTLEFDNTARTTTFTDARGAVTVDAYHGPALVTRIDALGQWTNYSYDAWFNLTREQAPSKATDFTYDDRGNLLARTTDDGHADVWTYNAFNEQLSHRDPTFYSTNYAYDAAGNLTTTTYPNATTTTINRQPSGTGLAATFVDQRGKVTTYGYDAKANLSSITTPTGAQTTQTYDAVGRPLTTIDPLGNQAGGNPSQHTTTFTYNAAGQVLTSTDPLGDVTTNTYDPAGNLLSVTDANQHATTYAYDAANHLVSVTDAIGGVTAYGYDAVGNRVQRTDAKNHVTTYTYDLDHRLTSTADPAGHHWDTQIVLDQVSSTTDPNGNTTSYTYNTSHRVARINYPEGMTEFAYDDNGNLGLVKNADVTQPYGHDLLNRLTTYTRNIPGGSLGTWHYTYDPAGNVIQRDDFYLNRVETSTYDDDGRMLTSTGQETDNVPDTIAPTVPTGLTATATASTQVNLAWTASSDAVGVQGYKLYRNGTYLSTVGPVGSVTFSDTGLTAATAYSYTVAAIDGSGNASAPSTAAAATTFGVDTTAPTVPTGVSASASAWNTVTVTWSASTDAVGVTRYAVYRGGTQLSVVNGTVLTLIDRSTQPSISYAYTVKALDAAGNTSAASSAGNVTTPACGTCTVTTTFTPTADAYVSNASGQSGTNFGTATTLLVTTTGDKKAYLKFDLTTLPAGTITGATLRLYSTVADPAGYGAYASTTTSWTETGIKYSNAPTYGSVLSASGAAAVNTWATTNVGTAITTRTVVTLVAAKTTTSNGTYQSRENTNKPQLVVTTYAIPGDTTAPTKPAGLTATAAGTSRINLAWTTSTDAVGVQGYKLYRGGTYLATVGPVGSVTFSDTGLTAATAYSYTVSAIDAAGNESAKSTAAAATTQGVDVTAPTKPTGVVATVTAWNVVTVTWTASTDAFGVIRYSIFRDGTLLAAVNGSSVSFTDRSTVAQSSYTYTVKASDAAGNTSVVSTGYGISTPVKPTYNLTTTYTYDTAGRVLTAAGPDGVTAKYAYDRAGRLLEVANVTAAGTLSRSSYRLDAVGNRVAITTTRGTEYATYDNLDRLTNVCYAASCAGAQVPVACIGCVGSPIATAPATLTPNAADTFATFTYDAVGNRMTSVDYLGTTTYAYDTTDRLTSTTAPGGAVTSYGYDANGNQTSAGTSTFTYNSQNQMTSSTVGGATTTYTYDGTGARATASTGVGTANTTKYLWDVLYPNAQLLTEFDGANVETRHYGYGLEQTYGVTPTTSPVISHHDGLGSNADLTSLAGASLAWTDFQPFGAARSAGVVAGSASSPFAFAGQSLDPTGLYYMRARLYDPSTARFTSVDPLPPATNRPCTSMYSYAHDNPLRLIDPAGLESQSPGCSPADRIGRVIGGVITVGGGTLITGVGTFLTVAAGTGEVAEIAGAPETVGLDLFLLPATIEVAWRGIGIAAFGVGVAGGGIVMAGEGIFGDCS